MSADVGPIVGELHGIMRESGLTLAVAESLTAGAVAAAIGREHGASDFFRGAIVAYHLDHKVELLGVDRDEAEPVHSVSTLVATQMATGVRDRFGAAIGLATTGWAEPDPDVAAWFPRAAWAVEVGDDGPRVSGWVEGAGQDRAAMIDRVVVATLRGLVEILRRRDG